MLLAVENLRRTVTSCHRWIPLRYSSRCSVHVHTNHKHYHYNCEQFKPQRQFMYSLYFKRSYSSQHAYKMVKKSRRTFYDILEVHPLATQTEIKSAYYELSMKYHPDVSSSLEAREQFTDITKAYSVLSKIETRREYDKEIGTYYMMRNYPKKSGQKVLRLMDDLVEIDMQHINQPSTFLHNAISLSTILRTPIRLNNIKNRTGVQSQDVRMLQLLRKVCNGTLVANKGSSTVTFIPSELQSGLFSMEAGRFGSVSLLVESALPCLMFGPLPEYSRTNILSLKGTTHCNYGLHMDFIDKVYRPLVNKFGLDFSLEMRKKSYIPHWDGKVIIRSLPVTHVKPASLTDLGYLNKITCLCFVAGSKPIRVAQIMAKNVLLQLKKKFPRTPIVVDSTRERDSRSEGNGQALIIVGETSTGHTVGGTALWQKGMSSDEVVNKAVGMFTRHIESSDCVDEVLQDKIILLMALASGHSIIRTGPLSARTNAAINAIETLTEVKFNINKDKDSRNVLISCEGLGLYNEYLDSHVNQ